LLYRFLKFLVRLAIKIFCRQILINKPDLLKAKGPLLLACNHPNSFLDGVILATLFDQPLYSLARGDVFRRPLTRKLLAALKLLPVYRTSEGVENLGSNYDTFRECIDIFQQNGIVIVFSEGRCINEWHLRPLKKGTARLALASWNQNIPLKILPVGINYSSFRRFGKNIQLNFGEVITEQDIPRNLADGIQHNSFNEKLERQLKKLVLEIDTKDRKKQKLLLAKNPTAFHRFFLFIPALIGFIFHLPLYIPVRSFAFAITRYTDHYDSVITAILLFTYPFYWLLLIFLVGMIWEWSYSLPLLLLPFTAWAYVQLKPQIDR
jgi:1-acyl-sn-glycerol-3-phosphate acyltransferase